MFPLVLFALFSFTLPLPLLLQFVVAVFLPLLVGLVTRRVTAATTKALLLLALSIVSAGVAELLASLNRGEMFDLGLWLLTALGSFVTGVALHFGLWKPIGASDAAQAVGAASPGRDARGRFSSGSEAQTRRPADD